MHRLLLTFLITLATCHPAFAAPAAKESPAKARDPYPLQTCVVSGEHLEAGQTVEYVHKEPGQPDRLVRFCCRKCLARFKADPAKYLQKLDEAAAKSGKTN